MSERPVASLDEDTIEVEAGGRRVRAAARCPHRKGLMVHGYLSTGKLHLTCPLHYSTFDLLTGCKLAGPAEKPLRVEVLE
jgi:nitrite reductase/ring-hydroxylating ferredoxin subunit